MVTAYMEYAVAEFVETLRYQAESLRVWFQMVSLEFSFT